MADNSDSGSMSAIVAIIAIIAIVAIGYVILRWAPMTQNPAGNGASINVNLPTSTAPSSY